MAEHDAEPLPESLGSALDTVDREVQTVQVARWLRRHNLSPETTRMIVRGLLCYLDGDNDRAAELLETVGEELRERTIPLK